MSGAHPFPWDEVLHFALRVLRWPPETVWRATPREIAAAFGTTQGAAEPIRRAELCTLMDLYPDGERHGRPGG